MSTKNKVDNTTLIEHFNSLVDQFHKNKVKSGIPEQAAMKWSEHEKVKFVYSNLAPKTVKLQVTCWAKTAGVCKWT